MSKSFTHDKPRICYAFKHYFERDVENEDLDENYILELIEDLPETQINIIYDEYTILELAVEFNHKKVVRYLLENYNVELNMFMLTNAIENNNAHIIEMLLDYDRQLKPNMTALEIAKVYGNAKIIKILEEYELTNG